MAGLGEDTYHDENVATNTEIIKTIATQITSEESRRVLLCYDPVKSSEWIVKEINRFKVPPIKDCAEFLKINTVGIKKDQLIINLVRQIETFMIEKCDVCKNNYSLEINEIPLFRCDNCRQGCHKECFQELADFLDQSKFPMITFKCSTCMDEDTPTVTPPTVKNANNTNDVNERSSTEDLLAISGNAITPQTQDIYSNENTDSTQRKIICRFYKNGSCKHGISGKYGGKCKFDHPKMCFKYRDYGSRGPKGCKESKCQYYHPKLCYNSLQTKECYNERCRFWHLKDVTRTYKEYLNNEYRPETHTKQYENPNESSNQQIFLHSNTNHNETHNNTQKAPDQQQIHNNNQNNSSGFLEIMQAHLAELKKQQLAFQQNISIQINQRLTNLETMLKPTQQRMQQNPAIYLQNPIATQFIPSAPLPNQ